MCKNNICTSFLIPSISRVLPIFLAKPFMEWGVGYLCTVIFFFSFQDAVLGSGLNSGCGTLGHSLSFPEAHPELSWLYVSGCSLVGKMKTFSPV